jgi:hypothetical protein
MASAVGAVTRESVAIGDGLESEAQCRDPF